MGRQLEAEDLYAFRLADDPQISPDGREVAYVVLEIDRPTYEYRRSLWVSPTAEGLPRQFTSGPNDSGPAWSPEGGELAFVRAPAPTVKPKTADERARGIGKPQIWVIPSDGGEARQLTFLRHGAANPVWSPDKTTILFTAEVGEPDDPEAEDAALNDLRVPAVRTLDRLRYRLDGKGWIYERRSHLFTVPAGGGEPRQLTDGDWDDESPRWSPDGRRIAFTSDRSEERWRWGGSDVWVLDLTSATLRRLTDESIECEAHEWSPDGDTVAFTASRRRQAGGHRDLFVAAASGATPPRSLTQEFLATCSDACIDDQRAHGHPRLYWSKDGSQIYFLASSRGTTHVYAAPSRGGEPRPLTQGRRRIYGFSPDADRGTVALASSDPATPGDVYVQVINAPGHERRITELNASLLGSVQLAVPQEFGFKGADGWDLQGWVLRPPSVPATERTPAILQIHGGPHAMYGWSFFFEFQLLAARGYTVIYTNPRGSTGFGRAFSTAVIKDWGGKDYEDLMAGLDAAIAQGGIDPDRLGVAGGSYGGFMTNWVVGHTNRFAAAVTMRCVSNHATMFGTSDIGWFVVDEIGGVPWDEVETFRKHSPISYAAAITTPLLILHSDSDLRCPISEGEQLYASLKFLNRDVKLVRFEGQSHDLSRSGHPRSRVIRLRHILDWFRARVQAKTPALAGAKEG